MRKSLLSNRLGRWLAGAALVVLATPGAHAQLAGTKTIPGSYATLAAAITDLNAQGVGTGGVTFNIAAGYTETFASPTVGAIAATGTSANPIVFQKAGTGANPVITAGATGTGTQDAIISLIGSDYVTFASIDVAENSANTTTAAQMEFGYALFRASATDGCQNVSITGATITLNKANASTIGIWGANTLATATAAVTSTSAAGANSNNKLNGNTVAGAYLGIYLTGNTSTVANADTGNEIGTTTGNTLSGLGGSNTIVYGVRAEYQQNLKVENNTITIPTGNTSTAVYGIGLGVGTATGIVGTVLLNNNTVSISTATTSTVIGILQGGSTAVTASTITNNKVQNSTLTGASGAFYGIQDAATTAATAVTITGNQITGNTAATTGALYALYKSGNAASATITISTNVITGNTKAGAGSLYGVYSTGTIGTLVANGNTVSTNTISASGAGTLYGLIFNTSNTVTNQTVNGNTVSGNQIAGSSGSIAGLFLGSNGTIGTSVANNNVITNNTIPNASGSTTSVIYGIYAYPTVNTAETMTGNTVTGLAIGGTNSATDNVVTGIFSNTSAIPKTITQNTVGNLTFGTAGAALGGTLTGILNVSGSTVTITQNKIYGLTANSAGGVVAGLSLTSGTTTTVANNLIGALLAPAATGLNAVTGFNITGGTMVNAYYNTIYLNASSSAGTFGTSGIYLGSTSAVLDARNNIIANTSTAAGTGGYTAALRRISGTAGTVPANYAATSNNNLFYAGAPSATSLIYVEGTTAALNAQQTLAAYKTFLGNRDQASVTENPSFLSTTGTAATFLHIDPSVATQVESAGTPISSITTDFDGDVRNATTPDIGADEGTFTPQDLTPPSITYAALGNTPSLTSRTLVVTITDASGVATGTGAPRIYYRKSTGTTYFSALATSVVGNTYTFTIDYANIGGTAVVGDVIQYYVAAQDVLGNTGTSPLGGTGTTPPGSTAPATPASYQVQPTLAGTYYVTSIVGSSPTPAREFATLTAAATAYNNSGLGGAVAFVLLDASYGPAETFPIVLTANASASAANTLTIKPNTGVTSTIASGSAATAVLQLNGADYITIDGSNAGTTSRNLTLTSGNSSAASAVVWLASQGVGAGATYVTLKNLNLVGGSPTQSGAFGVYAAGASLSTSGTGEDNDNLTIQNNTITTAYEAVYARGVASTGLLDNLLITGNTIGSATAASTVVYRGIDVQNAPAPAIQQNTIVSMITTASVSIAAIDLGANVTNAVVSRNRISNLRSSSTSGYGAYGVNISSGTTSGIEISNNMISDILTYDYSSGTTFNPFGIRITGGTGHKVYYNSVNLAGTIPSSSASSSNTAAAFVVTSSSATGLDVRNNIFACSVAGPSGNTTAKSYALYASAASSFATINYNDYYVSGSNGVLAYVGADVATLAALRTATGQDANSLSADPLFASATDLHASSVALDGAATPIAGVTIDIDGDPRNATTPDIGADEFTPLTNDLAPVALVAPAATSTCYGTAEAVSVSIRNAGTATLNFATNAATVTVVVTLPGGTTQTLTTTVNTGTLASNATQTVILPTTLNMSAAGTYSFAVTATVVGDGNTANDVLTPVPTRTVLAPVAGTLASASSPICVSGTATFTLTGAANGNIQYQSSSSATGTFTDITGATSATYTTPVLTTTTYYRVGTGCNTNVVYSNVVAIIVNNPLVATTNTPVSVCAGSTATLTATASAGSSVRFFNVATGGTALASATAGTYTTPALTTNTTYYAEAYSGAQENVGKALTNGADGTNSAGGLYFTATGPNTITNVTVYRTANAAAGTATIYLLSGSSTSTTNALATATVPVPANTTAAVSPTVLTLNFAVPAAGNYTLYLGAASPALVRDYTTAAPATSYPYTSPSGAVSITGATLASYYYFFFNWQLGTECAGATRTPIQVNVTQPATATFGYPATGGNCAGSTGTVAPTLTTGATAGTYSSTTGLTLNATTGAVNLATSTAGTYTVTNTVAASGSCGPVTATATFTVNPTPARPTLTPTYNGTVTTLTSSAATGNQFYFNGNLIAGATGQSYVVNGSPTTYGPYTVVVTNSFGCSSPASVATVVTTTRAGIAGASLLVYPNPTPTGQVTLELSGFRSATQLAILDALGRVVRAETLPATTGVVTHALDLSGMAPGVYLLRLTNADGVETRRLVRE
jgi:hypothetical protein